MTACLYCEPAFTALVLSSRGVSGRAHAPARRAHRHDRVPVLRAGVHRAGTVPSLARHVEYRAERTRLPAALTDMTACLYCEPAFTALVEKHRAVTSRGGGARGRGGRARNNKHRNKQPKDKMAQLAAYFV
ncbi:DNA topoisomerase 3-beta-1-like [Colias croceus]|uniref:DNA topoisomerase 3-beta-1-like n=1 Tax=Colias crocea TaxID=72248 RepID=UPI001E27DB09|nr:DNA topoisomerase 3-beta-1-like [Colias croceus]